MRRLGFVAYHSVLIEILELIHNHRLRELLREGVLDNPESFLHPRRQVKSKAICVWYLHPGHHGSFKKDFQPSLYNVLHMKYR